MIPISPDDVQPNRLTRRDLLMPKLPEQPADLWPHVFACLPMLGLVLGAANVAWCWARARWGKR